MRLTLRAVVMGAVLGLCSGAWAEQIDNPEYGQWAKYKAGTFTTMRQSMEMPGMAAMPGMPAGMDMSAMMPQTTITTKLTEVKAEALTLEVSTATSQMGQTQENKVTRTVPAKIEKPATTAPAARGEAADIKDLKEGRDTLDVKGKKHETVTREFTTTTTSSALVGGGGGGRRGRGPVAATAEAPIKAHMKVWTSEEVPLGTVKSEMTTTSADMGEMKMIMTLVDYAVVK